MDKWCVEKHLDDRSCWTGWHPAKHNPKRNSWRNYYQQDQLFDGEEEAKAFILQNDLNPLQRRREEDRVAYENNRKYTREVLGAPLKGSDPRENITAIRSVEAHLPPHLMAFLRECYDAAINSGALDY